MLDALLWVMGENAPSHLRGCAMGEFIFSGKGGKESGFSEVSLLLEGTKSHSFRSPYNSCSEVMLTRRLHREGRSEYLINSQLVRLTDIQDFFMDTGVGVHGFSFIEQGAVEKFISSKPSEKRALVESAAGISRFRLRKKEAAKKLLLTENHIDKLTELLHQQEKQLARLGKQAQKASQFEKLKTQIHHCDMNLSQNTLYFLNQSFHSLQQEYQTGKTNYLNLKNQTESLNQSVKVLKTQYEEAQKALTEQEKQEEYAKNQGTTLQSKILKLKAALSADAEGSLQFHQDIKHLKDTHRACEQSIHDLNHQQEQKKEQIRVCRESLVKVEKQHTDLAENLRVLEEEKQSLKSKVAYLAGEFKTQAEREKLWSEKLKELTQQVQELETKKQEEEKKLTKVVLHLKELHSQREETSQSRFKWMDSERALIQDIKSLNLKLLSREKSVSQRESDLQALYLKQQNLEKLKSSIWAESVPSSKEEGFFPLKKQFHLPSSIKKYEPVLMALLGVRLQAVFCDKKEMALSYLKTLTEEQREKGYYFILKEFQKIPPKEEVLKLKNEEGVLFLPVELSEEQKGFISDLFCRVVVVKDLKTAFWLKPLYPGWSFITEQAGEILTESGDLICGNYLIGGQMARRDYTQLQNLPSQIESCKAQIYTGKQAIKKTKALLHTAEDRRQGLKEKCRSSQFILLQIQKDLKSGEQKKEELNTNLKDLKNIMQNQQNKIKDLKEKHSSLRKKLLREQEGVDSYKEKLKTVEREYEHNRQKKEQVLNAREQFYRKELSLKKDLELFKEKLAFLSRSLEEYKKSQSRLSLRTEVAQKRIQDCKKDMWEKDIAYRDYRLKLKDMQREKAHFQKQCADLKSRLEEHQEELQLQYQEMVELEKQQSGLKLRCEALQLKKKNLKDRIYELYQVEVEAKPLAAGEKEEEKKSQLEDFKGKLARLGAVNLLALKEHKELNQEYEFYKKQYEDLQTSRKKLKEVIRRIEIFCSKKFTEAFEQVRHYFSKVFCALFEGGEAQLLLTEGDGKEEDPGLQIMVQPPGKKIQNMNLLSGGEKAMTALSLIFSLFLMKPSPFCVLDEIDAALDDLNIHRFSSLLKEMASVCQVLIITHNKHTMKTADKIFGVTMEEKGISKVLSMSMPSPAAEHPSPSS